MSEYVSKATTTKITGTSRSAIKIRDNYYTVELSEERSLPDTSDVDLEKERQILFDDINNIIDNQTQEIVDTFRKSSS